MYINLLYLPLFNFTYLFFLFFVSFPLNILATFVFTAVFPTWHLFCFPLCALVSFVLVDIIFGFLCLLDQYIVLHFCWTVLILHIRCIFICVYSVTLFTVVINLCLYFGLLQFCGIFLFLFFSLLSFLCFIILIFNHIIFFYIYSFAWFSYCSFPLAVNL